MKSTKLMTAYMQVMSIKYIHVHVTHSKTKVTMANTHTMSCGIIIDYIPPVRDKRPVIFCGEEKCLNEALKVTKANTEGLRRLHNSTPLSRGV